MTEAENRKDRFIRVATKRTNDVLEKIRILGNCSNKSSYEYAQEEINQIFSTLERALKETKSRFIFKKKNSFSLKKD